MTKQITIKKDIDGEYRVPSLKGDRDEDGAYYTDEREDAFNTCYAIHGSDVDPVVRNVRHHGYGNWK